MPVKGNVDNIITRLSTVLAFWEAKGATEAKD